MMHFENSAVETVLYFGINPTWDMVILFKMLLDLTNEYFIWDFYFYVYKLSWLVIPSFDIIHFSSGCHNLTDWIGSVASSC